MTHVRLRKLLCLAGLGLLPGCLPASLQQELAPSPSAIRVTSIHAIREGPPPEAMPQATLVVGSQPHEQEIISPRAIITQRMALPDPTTPSEVPIDQLPVPEMPADPALVSAVRAYLAGDLELTRKHLGQSRSAPTLSTQEELLGLLKGLHEKDLDQLASEEAGLLLGKVERLARAVQTQAPLLLQGTCFCRRIKAFGIYDPLPAERAFQTGVNGQPGEKVFVYGEMRNVAQRKDGSCFVVLLDGSLEVLNDQGEIVFRTDCLADPDRRRSQVTDVYVGFEFNIPASMPSGKYQVRIHVRDLAGRQPRQVSQTLDFRVVDPVIMDTR